MCWVKNILIKKYAFRAGMDFVCFFCGNVFWELITAVCFDRTVFRHIFSYFTVCSSLRYQRGFYVVSWFCILNSKVDIGDAVTRTKFLYYLMQLGMTAQEIKICLNIGYGILRRSDNVQRFKSNHLRLYFNTSAVAELRRNWVQTPRQETLDTLRNSLRNSRSLNAKVNSQSAVFFLQSVRNYLSTHFCKVKNLFCAKLYSQFLALAIISHGNGINRFRPYTWSSDGDLYSNYRNIN